jgi:hypothetical protein
MNVSVDYENPERWKGDKFAYISFNVTFCVSLHSLLIRDTEFRRVCTTRFINLRDRKVETFRPQRS